MSDEQGERCEECGLLLGKARDYQCPKPGSDICLLRALRNARSALTTAESQLQAERRSRELAEDGLRERLEELEAKSLQLQRELQAERAQNAQTLAALEEATGSDCADLTPADHVRSLARHIDLLQDDLHAERERSKALEAAGPPLVYESNGEAGDGQHFCSLCKEERDEPHTWEQCARRLAGPCCAVEQSAPGGTAGLDADRCEALMPTSGARCVLTRKHRSRHFAKDNSRGGGGYCWRFWRGGA